MAAARICGRTLSTARFWRAVSLSLKASAGAVTRAMMSAWVIRSSVQ
jgi:hypothetical protein